MKKYSYLVLGIILIAAPPILSETDLYKRVYGEVIDKSIVFSFLAFIAMGIYFIIYFIYKFFKKE